MHFWRTCSIEQSAMNFPWLLASLLFKGQPVWLFPRKLTTGWWFGTWMLCQGSVETTNQTVGWGIGGYISCAAPRNLRLPLVHEPKTGASCQAWPGKRPRGILARDRWNVG
jgi:hypothetical protein